MQFDTFDPNGATAIRMSSGVATNRVIAGLWLRPRHRRAVRRDGIHCLGVQQRNHLDARDDERRLPNIDQDTEGEIDVLYAAAVPEPETYALFAAGLGLLSFVGRRRKAKR